MKIAIVSAAFDERERIGALRPRNLVTWLAAFGHEVTVITRSEPAAQRTTPVDLPGVTVLRIPRLAILRGLHAIALRVDATLKRWAASGTKAADPPVGEKPQPRTGSVRAAAVGLGALLYRVADDGLWVLSAARTARAGLDPDTDVIVSSYGPFASLWLGWRLAKGLPRARWIADFRDPMVWDDAPDPVNPLLRRHQRAALSAADAVTTVSVGLRDWFVEQLTDETARAAVHLIPNGFEGRFGDRPRPDRADDGVLRIGYTGRLYPGRSDASSLFAALAALIASEGAGAVDVEVHYAGRSGALFREQAAAHGLADLVTDHGFLPRSEVAALQGSCDVLLVLSWNDVGRTGVLTGKIYEYMRSAQPVLALTSGSLPGAELTHLVDDLRLGNAYEYVTHDRDFPQLVAFLQECLAARGRGERPYFDPSDGVHEFEYEKIARRFESLCRAVVPETGARAAQTDG